jgi:hypothetical protein
MQLSVCRQCRRHVGVSETACPFCGAPREHVMPGRPLLGKVTRAAVFASVSASAACWSNSPATSTTTSDGSGNVSNHSGGSAVPAEDVSIPPPRPGMVSIGGICRDGATGQPLAGVNVELIPGVGAGKRGVKSDARGRYAVDDLAPGDWNVRFWGPRDAQRMAPPSQFVTLKAGESKRIDGNVDNRDWSNVPMPYGAPPARRRVV